MPADLCFRVAETPAAVFTHLHTSRVRWSPVNAAPSAAAPLHPQDFQHHPACKYSNQVQTWLGLRLTPVIPATWEADVTGGLLETSLSKTA